MGQTTRFLYSYVRRLNSKLRGMRNVCFQLNLKVIVLKWLSPNMTDVEMSL